MLHLLVPFLVSAAPPQDARPDEIWDADRVREVAEGIQDQIEVLRGLEFHRSVGIELADREGFLAYARAVLEANGGRDRIQSEQAVARLLGLIPGDMDLIELTTRVLVEQVGGFYDPSAEKFYVMESVQPDLARIVIAHEFTHALDDQHFDLDGTLGELANNADAIMAYHAVIEGSGMELMFEWAKEHMDFAARSRVAAAQAELPSDAVSEAPPAVWKPLVALYYQGQAFLRRQSRPSPFGSAARMTDINRALASPPRSTEQVLHPSKYWNPEHLDEPVDVALTEVPEGAELVHENTLGELHAAMITTPFAERGGLNVDLSSLLGLRFTNDAAAGWGGDRYALLEVGEGQLLYWSTVWDTEEDADEFAQVLADLTRDIEHAKSSGEDYDANLSGLLVERVGDMGVKVLSWSGLEEQRALSIAEGVRFEARG